MYTEELERRRLQSLPLVDESFPKQAEFLKDKSKFIAAWCTRRAGKSYGGALRMAQDGRDNPGVNILYIALTRETAKKIMWKDCLKVVNKKYKMGMKFNETTLTATFPNGSVIHLAGADAKPDEMEKFLGQKYLLVVVDECASFKQDFRKLIYGALKPAVADLRGTIVLIGTPGNLISGLFYDVTNGKEPGWSVHKWTAFDNPYMATQWQEEIDQLTTMNPLVKETALFRQNYLGEWVIEQDALVYKYDDSRNRISSIPLDSLYYVIGVDLGYSPDPSAFVICAYSEFDPNLYIVETYKQTEMIVSDVAERIRYYMGLYPNAKIVVDAANKQAVEEMRQRYALPIIAAEKQGKPGFIELMNSDLIMGVVKLVRGRCNDLVDEWRTLIWDDEKTKRAEHAGCANHLSDAALYAWRWAYNYAHRARPKIIHPGTEEAIDLFWQKEAERLEREKNEQLQDSI